MSFRGLMRTYAEIWRATKSVSDTGEVSLTWALLGTAHANVQRARGNMTRRLAGEEIEIHMILHVPPGTAIEPEHADSPPDRVRVEGGTYVCVFVDRGPKPYGPVKVELSAVASAPLG